MIERTIYFVMLLLISMIIAILSVVSCRRRATGTAAIYLSICLMSVAIYCFGYAMELQSDKLRTVMFWVRFQHWGIDLIAPTWLLFALAVTGYDKKISKRLLVVYFIIPVILLVMSQTLGWLNLGHHNPRLDTSGPFPVFMYDRSLYNYFVIGYYSLYFLASVIFYVILFLRSAPSIRTQAGVYLIGSLPPWITFVFHNLNLFQSNIDLTALAFGVSGVFFAVGFMKFRILDIVPLARDTIFENMKAPVLILDMDNRVIDYNPALKSVFSNVKSQDVGKPINDIFPDYHGLLSLVENDEMDRIEFVIGEDKSAQYFHVNISPIFNIWGKMTGRILGFNEFTEEKRLMEKFEKLAVTDGLTGIFNRQHFDGFLRKEISSLMRYGGQFSLTMLDLDHFKLINDTYGHLAGDQALIAVVETFRTNLRESDIMARFGGEEFLILTPHTGYSDAKQLAERLRLSLEQKPIQVDEQIFNVQASFGVICVDIAESITPEKLYRLVDKMTYKAKALGGNVVCVSRVSESK